MSETDTRKSMDDVLASIRRIVRAEKDPDSAYESAEPQVSDAESELDVPLELTPDMRMDGVAEDQFAAPEFTSEDNSGGGMIDPAEIRDMVRDVVLEELGGDRAGELVRSVIRDELVNGEVGQNISQNVMTLIQTEVEKALKG